VHFALKDAADEFVNDVEHVVLAVPGEDNPPPAVELEKGQAPIFYLDSVPGGNYVFRVERPGRAMDFLGQVQPLGTTALLAKLSPFIARVQPAAGAVGTLSLAADSLVSLFGNELAGSEEAAVSLPLRTELAGTTVSANGEPLGLLYASPTQINAYLPPGLTGLVRFTVLNPSGRHSVDILLDRAVPAVFAWDGSGQGPAAALHALSHEPVDLDNPAAAVPAWDRWLSPTVC
jgi:hypothetical protein